jgi:hypothetical protein
MKKRAGKRAVKLFAALLALALWVATAGCQTATPAATLTCST